MALRLDWPDERYVRVYCRDTAEWLALSWDAQGLYVLLLRKATRTGTIPLGRLGRQALAALLGRADLWDRLEPALAELERDGCVRVQDDVLVFEQFRAAQEAVSSSAARSRAYRERRAAEEARHETLQDAGDETLQSRDKTSHEHDETSQDSQPATKRVASVTRNHGGTARHGTAPHSTERHGASDGTSTEPSQKPPGKPNGSPPASERAGAFDEEAQAVLRLLPAKAVDIATTLGLPATAVDDALEDFRRRGLVRLRGGLVPLWELAP